ncbi:MAG: hypothetical protein Q4C98_10825 [Capnocytophaga sp.]|nr:hypothetical protein [Capnocytophaga sp.]
MAKRKLPLETFQKYGAIFENISKNETLKNVLSEYGYDEQEITKGKNLYDFAVEKLDISKRTTTEEKLAYDDFSKKYDTLKKTYSEDRKKAKVIFKNEEKKQSALGVKGVLATKFSVLLDMMDTFYKQLQSNEELSTPLKPLKITEEYIASQLEKIEEVKQANFNYTNKKGKSQQATLDKDVAFWEVETWVTKFYGIAKIVLKDQPQLLESIGKSIRT